MSFSFSIERLSRARNVLPRCGMIVHRNRNPRVAALTCTENTKQDSSKIAQGSRLYLLLLLLLRWGNLGDKLAHRNPYLRDRRLLVHFLSMRVCENKDELNPEMSPDKVPLFMA